MIYLLTAIGLSPGSSTHLHIKNTQNNTNNNRTTQIQANVEECGPCPIFASFTLAFALQLRKKHGKTSVRVRKTSVKVQYTYYQKYPHITKPSQTHTHYKTHSYTHTRIHTLQNNIKPPQYKLKQNAYRKSNSPEYMLVVLQVLLTLRRLMSYIYGAPILDVSRSHTTTQHSR